MDAQFKTVQQAEIKGRAFGSLLRSVSPVNSRNRNDEISPLERNLGLDQSFDENHANHSKSLILIKHYETESAEPVKIKHSSPKFNTKSFKKLSNNALKKFNRNLKFSADSNSALNLHDLVDNRSKSIENLHVDKNGRGDNKVVNSYPSKDFQTIQNSDSYEKLLR